MISINKFKRRLLMAGPVGTVAMMLAIQAVHADPLISTASSTAMLTTISTNVWDVFYTNFPLIVGVVVLFTIVIALAAWLLGKISSIGRHK